jgi:hypothetical protein
MPRGPERWESLFGDLEAQLDAAEAAELAGEVAERSRFALGELRVVDRVIGSAGHPVVVTVLGAGVVRGVLRDAGVDWLLLEEQGAREVLVPQRGVLGVTGLGSASQVPSSEGEVGRRLDLRRALRGLARSRTGLALTLADGSTVTGTLDRVGADHVELAEHAPGEARRAGAVRQVRLVPLTAVGLVRSSS